MRDFVNKEIKKIKPSGIRKFFDIAKEIDGAISLGVGEPDFDTPWHIREEGIYSLERGKTYYTSNAGLKDLRIEICNFMNRKYNISYDINDVFVNYSNSTSVGYDYVKNKYYMFYDTKFIERKKGSVLRLK